MVSTLNCRTSIVAAMNPVRSCRADTGIDELTALPPPLVSRFDIVMLLLDGMDARQCAPMRG